MPKGKGYGTSKSVGKAQHERGKRGGVGKSSNSGSNNNGKKSHNSAYKR